VVDEAPFKANPSVVTIVEIDHDGVIYQVHANFLLSAYKCIYGQGCPGHFGIQNAVTRPEVGCCSRGSFFETREDLERVRKWSKELTEDDMDRERLAYMRKNEGVYVIKDDPSKDDGEVVGRELKSQHFSGATRLLDGACVFANRSTGSAGKAGCALHHLSTRLGIEMTETKPTPCFWLPLHVFYSEDEEERRIARLGPATIDSWENWQPQEAWSHWWCVDSPEAYISKTPMYRTYEEELRFMFGPVLYEKMVAALEALDPKAIEPMPGEVRNNRRPLLPLLIGNRKPERPNPAFDTLVNDMREQGENYQEYMKAKQ
jgi:hypothetical protein